MKEVLKLSDPRMVNTGSISKYSIKANVPAVYVKGKTIVSDSSG